MEDYMEFEDVIVSGHAYFRCENNIHAAISEDDPGEIVGEYISDQPVFNKVREWNWQSKTYYVSIDELHIIYEKINNQPCRKLGCLNESGMPNWD